MIIYHTCASEPDIAKANDIAPSFTHGYGWIPEKMSIKDAPWFLDNGAYGAWKKGEEWSPDGFVERLNQIDDRMPRDPDFVVLPDIYQEGVVSLARSSRWAERIADYGFDYYLPVQDGMPVEQSVRAAVELDASGVFIGGSDEFKKEFAGQFSMTAHDYDLQSHLGKPGGRLTWARDLGVDSIDTASVVRNGYWHRLRKLESAPETEEITLEEGWQ